jgi:hypothetical protein
LSVQRQLGYDAFDVHLARDTRLNHLWSRCRAAQILGGVAVVHEGRRRLIHFA